MSYWGDKRTVNKSSVMQVSQTEAGQYLKVRIEAQEWEEGEESTRGQICAGTLTHTHTHTLTAHRASSFSFLPSILHPSLPCIFWIF